MSSILKDYVHCPVCYELLQGPQHEPYALQCLHTLCHNCVDLISQCAASSQQEFAKTSTRFVKCPQCKAVSDRTLIKRDFRTKSLVEDYLKDKNKINNKGDRTGSTSHPHTVLKCGMCEDVMKAIKSKCIDCALHLCSECESGHKKIPALKLHTLQSVTAVAKSVESGIKKTLVELEKLKSTALQIKSNISSEICLVDKSSDDAVKKINKARAKLHKEIDSCHDALLKQVEEEKSRLKQNVNTRKGEIDVMSKDIQGKVTLLNDILKKKDKNKLMISGDVTNQHILGNMALLQERMEDIQKQKTKLTISVVTSSDGNIANCTNINITTDVASSSAARINHPTDATVDNLDYATHENIDDTATLNLVFSAKVNYRVLDKNIDVIGKGTGRRINIYNSELWCTTWNALHIHNIQDGELIKSIFWEIDEWASAVIPAFQVSTRDQNMLIVAYYYAGLQCVDDDGRQIQFLCDGEFSDVTMQDQKVFALEWTEQKVFIFEFDEMEERWHRIGLIQLNYENEHSCDKLFVKDEQVYVSSWNNNCFHIFTLEGDFISSYGVASAVNSNNGQMTAGVLSSPKLCKVDDEGSVLLADTDNKRMQWCSAVGAWEVVLLPCDIGEPEDAVTEVTCESMWILTNNGGYKLMKFK